MNLIDAELVNPYSVDPRKEFPHVPEHQENWTEYHYFFAYDKDADIGMSLHIGRLVEDLSIWRGILYVFMPGDEVLVHKCVGRGEHARGFNAGPLAITCVEPMQLWTIDFDGAAHSTTGKSLCRDVLRDGVDEVIKLHIQFEAASPFFSLDPSRIDGLAAMGWAHDHHEQIHTIKGEIVRGGEAYRLCGMGIRDHSSGPRDTGKPFGGVFFNALFPSGKAVSFTMVKTKTYDGSYGYLFWGDGSPLEQIRVIESEPINDAATPLGSVHPDVAEGSPRFRVVLGTSRGEQVMEVERRRSIATTYVPPHHEVAGTDYARPEAAQQTKTVALVTWDGEVGTCQLDRYVRIKTLKR
ncbi:hypothetical protein [Massilia cavernae]|uniref:Uncharacterized protein n=1 Tax=Massilia cavernae TaxID=2320864 RepID=A0A418X766_9BURK|nr:hypothetical protein [Massilia cavernae]RJG08290.1 hypothetical protein D3872_24800 [Massilia cavernae]